MRVLLVVPSMMKNGGGVSENVPQMAVAMKRAGLDVGIAYYAPGEQSESAKRAFAAGVNSHIFKGNAPWWNPIGFSFDLVRRFEEVARDYDFMIVHMNWMFPVWWPAHVARKLGKPYVMMPNGSFAPNRLKISAWKKRLVGVFDRYAARRARAIWATAESEAKDVKAYLPGVKTAVFPIGLEASEYTVASTKPKEERILLYMSRISRIKGLDMLAEAWGRVRPEGWRLVIAGPDDRGYTDRIKTLFDEKCDRTSFEFRSAAFGEEKSRLLLDASAFILPTRNENWGIAVAEAMASGLPVICTKGAPWQCLESEDAGWWTDISAAAIEKAIREMTSMSSVELSEKGLHGRAWIEKELDWGAIGQRMKGWIQQEQ